MARLFAQVFSLVFFVATFGGLLLGDASHGSGGVAGGNLGSITLHLTWWRDALDALVLAALVYAGFVADRRSGRILVTAVGALLLALSIGGFISGDDDVASTGF